MKNQMILACVGIVFAAANGVRADDLVLDNYARVSVVATNGDVSVDSIFSAPKAVGVEKTGTSALTLAADIVQTRDPVPVRVLEGTLNLVPGTDPGLAEPACLQRAALWLDASRGSTLVPPDGATGDEVARWYDVRETFANGQWSTNYYCAEARKSFVTNEVSPGVWEKVIRYPVKKTALTNGMDFIDFNGRASGILSSIMFFTVGVSRTPGDSPSVPIAQCFGIQQATMACWVRSAECPPARAFTQGRHVGTVRM